MKAKIVEPDVPQELLDLTNVVDWSGVTAMQIRLFKPVLHTYVVGTLKLPQKPRKRTIRSDASKRVAVDVPQALLDEYNGVDWAKLSPAEVTAGIARLRSEAIPKLGLPYKR